MINKVKFLYCIIAVFVGLGCSDTKKTGNVENVQQAVAIEQTTLKVEIPSEPKKQNEPKHSKDNTPQKEVQKKKNPDGYYNIPYDKKARNIKVEDLFKNVRFVRLETNENCLVNENRNKIECKNGIIYMQNDRPSITEFLLFNKEGKYLRSICKQGEGPEEYSNAMNIAINSKGDISVADCTGATGRIVTYSSDGNFISHIKLPGIASETPLTDLLDITYLNDSVLLIKGDRGWVTKNQYQTFNIYTKKVIRNMHLVKRRPYHMYFPEGFVTYQSKAIIASYQSNQILEATEDTVRVKYTFNIGNKMPPAGFWEEQPSYEVTKKEEVSNEYIGHIPFFAENDRYMFISFMGSLGVGNLQSLALVEKATGKSRTFKRIVLADNMMIEPIDFFWQSNGEIIIPIWPHEIIESENKEFLSQFPDLKEDDNPILLIGELI
ncbi:MAG: 6-bladed beta-propeller [Bacteroidaceae bacterium]|nr:6-bladed beta-propeller [Bacteroidaceae bacterium]